MNSRERTRALLHGGQADRVGFWMGNPHEEAKSIYLKYFNLNDGHELSDLMCDDLVWILPEVYEEIWRHPEGKPMFDTHGGRDAADITNPGVFADCTDTGEVGAHYWADASYLDFSRIEKEISIAEKRGVGIFSGMCAYFYHLLPFYFGTENYFIKMYTHPEVVEAVTDRLIQFYLEANRLFFDRFAHRIDAYFIGNDFGSQEDLMISNQLFRKFLLPGFKKLIDQAKSYNLKVILHSCGAIYKVIPLLIEAGVDALHPLQAKARGMEPEKLAREFGKDLLFIGGIDTQELLPFGTPGQVGDEVRRLKKVFSDCRYIVSPSHEALLPNVSPENLIAMRDAAIW